MEINQIHHQDFTTNHLPDKSVQLIIADPPYFEVKGEFDFIWETFEDYLQDVEKWAAECERLLADNGTLFWWGDAKKLAYSQIILDKRFRLLNNIVWEKKECQTRRNRPEDQRSFAPVTERLLMYDKGEDKSGLEMILADPKLFQGIKRYFDEWLDKSGLTLKQAVAAIGSSCTHWFGFSTRPKTQFAFPTKEKWDKMEAVFPNFRDYETLRKEYEELREEYEQLRQQYESLRRPFELPYLITDVMLYSQESNVSGKYNHDTQKPEKLTRMLIDVTTKPGDLVFIPFAGSGTECAMAVQQKRAFIGFDIEKKYVDLANQRVQGVKDQMKQLDIFDLGA